MSPQDVSIITDAMQVMVSFGFMDGIFYTLGALKLVDLLYDFFDWSMPRLSRYLKRVR